LPYELFGRNLAPRQRAQLQQLTALFMISTELSTIPVGKVVDTTPLHEQSIRNNEGKIIFLKN
jgi:hypothetical protein